MAKQRQTLCLWLLLCTWHAFLALVQHFLWNELVILVSATWWKTVIYIEIIENEVTLQKKKKSDGNCCKFHQQAYIVVCVLRQIMSCTLHIFALMMNTKKIVKFTNWAKLFKNIGRKLHTCKSRIDCGISWWKVGRRKDCQHLHVL